jgi:hypothetical protein
MRYFIFIYLLAFAIVRWVGVGVELAQNVLPYCLYFVLSSLSFLWFRVDWLDVVQVNCTLIHGLTQSL